jgi:hypothetical protein
MLRRGRRSASVLFLFERRASSLADILFTRMHRMPRAVFYVLLDELKEHDARSSRPALSMKLSMATGGSYLDVSLSHNVAVSSFFAN